MNALLVGYVPGSCFKTDYFSKLLIFSDLCCASAMERSGVHVRQKPELTDAQWAKIETLLLSSSRPECLGSA